MATQQTRLGWRGEAAARAWLEGRGWIFLNQNFRTRAGEIDLIMQDGTTTVFVEVKVRRSARFGSAVESVSSRKLERLAAAADAYLQLHPEIADIRFDLVAIDAAGGRSRTTHVRGLS